MKKTIIAIIAAGILIAFGAVAYAHGPFFNSRHMGKGHASHMMDSKCGGMRCEAANNEVRKFMDETYGLRKELHDKKFEYREALLNPETTLSGLKNLKEEIRDLKKNIREKAREFADMEPTGYRGCRK
ncbi:MAG: hypothetical protein HY809_10685 [Nitrospirae bacterium]|nr:hypothetical protein [Nitrospirota bacterium]